MLRGGILPPINKLTEVKIKNIKPNGKIERYADGGGLYLEVSAAGGKHWRMKYRVDAPIEKSKTPQIMRTWQKRGRTLLGKD